MENKSFRVDINQVEEFLRVKAIFGWTLVNKEDLRGNQTILLNMERDPSKINDYYTLKVLEKQYASANRKFPTAALVLAIIGAGFLAGYFVLQSISYFAFSCLVSSLTFFLFAIIFFVLYILLVIKRKAIINKILNEASIRSGVSNDYPNKNNTKEQNDATWALSNTINKK